MNIRLTATAIVGALFLAPAAASAQSSDADRTAARALGQAGHEALDNKDFTTAVDRFTRADALIHAPTFLLGIAQAQVGLGKLASALETYQRLVREGLPSSPPPAFLRALDAARKELAALALRVPYLTIEVTGAGARAARITIDGVEVRSDEIGTKRAVDPGKHLIRAVAEGFAPAEATVTSLERKVEQVTLEPRATPAPSTMPEEAAKRALVAPEPKAADALGSTRKMLGVIGLGVGGAGLAVGAVMGGLVISKHGDILKSCLGGHCPEAQRATLQPQLDSYHALSAGSTAGFIVGGALAATGVVLVLTAPKAAPVVGAAAPWMTIDPVIGVGYAGAEGSF